MKRRPANTQLFALHVPPPAFLMVAGRKYLLVRVFKHDFYAATALYENAGQEASADRPASAKLVVKFGREQPFCGIPMEWIGRWLLQRERRLHKCVDGVPGVQRWIAQISPTAYALEYIEGKTLDHLDGPPPPEFFDRLRELLDAFHARGAAYGDMNKRSNIIVKPDGQPALIDFQISLVRGDLNPVARWWTGRWVAYLQRMDLYHLYKHKRRLAPAELSGDEELLSRRRGRMVQWHRRLFTPVRTVRRWFLSRLYTAGRLVSPSSHLEDHHQPEKATWRKKREEL